MYVKNYKINVIPCYKSVAQSLVSFKIIYSLFVVHLSTTRIKIPFYIFLNYDNISWTTTEQPIEVIGDATL